MHIQSVKGHKGVKGEGMLRKRSTFKQFKAVSGKQVEEVKDTVGGCMIFNELLALDICY